MTPSFHHVALIGKYHHAATGTVAPGSREVLEDIAALLVQQGCQVSLESQTAENSGISGYEALTPEEIGTRCDLGLVVGGDGTMLSIGRKLARFGTPLIGINQGRLGFVTDIPLEDVPSTLVPMLHGISQPRLSQIWLCGPAERPAQVLPPVGRRHVQAPHKTLH